MKQRRCFKYLRLSSEDEAVAGQMRDESNSIANQRSLLNRYIQTHPDIGTDFEELIDDGYTGTSFQRPGMKKLLSLVEADQVDTVIVKDLSRFGRNYLEAGYYIELVFPAHRTRLIAVNDHYDSIERHYSAGDIDLALNNLKNEFYSRDNSAKVKSSLDVQRRSGQFSGRVPYGYVKGPTKREILVDEEAAKVVRYIFHLAADEHMRTSEIAQQLNARDIPSPSLYRKQKWGYKGKVQPVWTVDSVFHILINRIFTGSFEMYKRHLNSVGSKKMTVVSREERVVIPNTHEAIVSEDIFNEAQKVMDQWGAIHRKESYVRKPHAMLAKYLKCGCCGVRLIRPNCSKPIYICRTAGVRIESPCEKVICDAKALEPVVFQAICNLTELAEVEYDKGQQEQNQLQTEISSIKNRIRSLSQKRKEITAEKLALYEMFQSGQLDKAGFAEQKQEADGRANTIMEEIETLTGQLSDITAKLDEIASRQQEVAPMIGNATCLTPELLQSFVSKVLIHEGGQPEIEFRMKDIFTSKK